MRLMAVMSDEGGGFLMCYARDKLRDRWCFNLWVKKAFGVRSRVRDAKLPLLFIQVLRVYRYQVFDASYLDSWMVDTAEIIQHHQLHLLVLRCKALNHVTKNIKWSILHQNPILSFKNRTLLLSTLFLQDGTNPSDWNGWQHEVHTLYIYGSGLY